MTIGLHAHVTGCLENGPIAGCDFCAPAELETLQIIQGLDAAIRILNSARSSAAAGSLTVWRLLDHAAGHLDKQIEALLKA
jgi:hypothetical protein